MANEISFLFVWDRRTWIFHLDNAIVDHVVPHDRSISRNVPKCPNGLRTKILKIDTPPVASIKRAPKQREEQNIGERKFKAPQNFNEPTSDSGTNY